MRINIVGIGPKRPLLFAVTAVQTARFAIFYSIFAMAADGMICDNKVSNSEITEKYSFSF